MTSVLSASLVSCPQALTSCSAVLLDFEVNTSPGLPRYKLKNRVNVKQQQEITGKQEFPVHVLNNNSVQNIKTCGSKTGSSGKRLVALLSQLKSHELLFQEMV